MHYVPNVELAFYSVEHIMRDVNYGTLLRYMHSNGASMFFVVVYLHVLKGLYYGSYLYPRQWIWVVGIVILLLMILTAFFGYILPWGQMSFWAATVITNLCTSIPLIGTDLVYWIWGGYSVGNPTLNRFFVLHFLLPFVILALVIIHLLVLHNVGSNNPLGISIKQDSFPFTGFFLIKDFLFYIMFFIFAIIFIYFFPNVLAHPDNYMEANPLVTPNHIVPEWYFLPYYAILRAVPNKLFGTILLVLSIISLLLLPFHKTALVRPSVRFGWYSILFFYLFVFCVFILGWVGGKPIETPFYEVGQISTCYYFLYLFVLCRGIWIFDSIFKSQDSDSWFIIVSKKRSGFSDNKNAGDTLVKTQKVKAVYDALKENASNKYFIGYYVKSWF